MNPSRFFRVTFFYHFDYCSMILIRINGLGPQLEGQHPHSVRLIEVGLYQLANTVIVSQLNQQHVEFDICFRPRIVITTE